jgi:hypothetical protein
MPVEEPSTASIADERRVAFTYAVRHALAVV